eukprot:NODE_104_length_19294_cov_0.449179.p3 type:complete len:582 gc:universal NODE_104_length_19294_cov_0.449179:13065-11320(-)
MLIKIFDQERPLEDCILINSDGVRVHEDDPEKDIFVFPKDLIANIPDYQKPNYPFIPQESDEDNDDLRVLHIAEQAMLHIKSLADNYHKLFNSCKLYSRAAQSLATQVNTHPSVLIFNIRPLKELLSRSKDWLDKLNALEEVKLPVTKLSDWYTHCETSVKDLQQLVSDLKIPLDIETMETFNEIPKDFSPLISQADLIYTKLLSNYKLYIEKNGDSFQEDSNVQILENLVQKATEYYKEGLNLHLNEYHEFVNQLESVREHQSNIAIFIRDQKESQLLFESVQEDVRQLEILQDILGCFSIGIAEFSRRKAWEDNLADIVENASDLLDNAFKDEIERRDSFLSTFRPTSSVRNALSGINWFKDLDAALPSFNIEFSRDRLSDPPFQQLEILGRDIYCQCLTYKQYTTLAQTQVNFKALTTDVNEVQFEELLKENQILKAKNAELQSQIASYSNLFEWLADPRSIHNVLVGNYTFQNEVGQIRDALLKFTQSSREKIEILSKQIAEITIINDEQKTILNMIERHLSEYRTMLLRLLAPPRNLLQKMKGSFYDVEIPQQSISLMEILVQFGETVKLVYNKYR